jgi:hypothetical protein
MAMSLESPINQLTEVGYPSHDDQMCPIISK